MSELTREQVEELRTLYELNLAVHAEPFNALCDMALKSLAPSATVAQCAPCRHEWYQGACVHCELPASEYRAMLAATPAPAEQQAEPVAVTVGYTLMPNVLTAKIRTAMESIAPLEFPKGEIDWPLVYQAAIDAAPIVTPRVEAGAAIFKAIGYVCRGEVKWEPMEGPGNQPSGALLYVVRRPDMKRDEKP